MMLWWSVELVAEVFVDGSDEFTGVLVAEPSQLGMTGGALGIPLIGESAVVDLVGDRAHRSGEVEMVESAPTRELAVPAGG